MTAENTDIEQQCSCSEQDGPSSSRTSLRAAYVQHIGIGGLRHIIRKVQDAQVISSPHQPLDTRSQKPSPVPGFLKPKLCLPSTVLLCNALIGTIQLKGISLDICCGATSAYAGARLRRGCARYSAATERVTAEARSCDSVFLAACNAAGINCRQHGEVWLATGFYLQLQCIYKTLLIIYIRLL